MSSDSDNLFLIVMAFVAGFIILQLRRTLGRRDGYDGKDEKPNDSEFTENKADRKPAHDNVIPTHGGASEKSEVRAAATEAKDIGLPTSSPFYETLLKINNYDGSFSLPGFIDGAEYAYGMILNAFWGGDTKTLRTYLSRDVFAQFEEAINDMKENGQEFHNEVNDIEKIELDDASIEGTMAELTLRFRSHMTITIKDKDGNLIEGDPEKVVKVNDIWTFCRDVKRGDPNWTLVSTTNA